MTTITRHLRLRAATSPVTSNLDKHLMMQAAEQIEHLQRLLNDCKKQADTTYEATPWEVR